MSDEERDGGWVLTGERAYCKVLAILSLKLNEFRFEDGGEEVSLCRLTRICGIGRENILEQICLQHG